MTDSDTIRKLLDQYEQSGLTQRAFASQAGVAYSTFTSWLRKARASAVEGQSSQWIEASPLSMTPNASTAFVLEWPAGPTLRIGRGVDPEQADHVINLLARLCSR